MAGMIDPAADFLWESVSTTVSGKETVEKHPQTDEEWGEVRRQAIILAEGANLIMMDGRHVVKEGGALEDHGTPGNLTAAESEQAIAKNRGSFLAFAQALRDVGASMLAAADAKNPQGLIDAGDTMDQVCEGCHLKFWYPGQKIPLFPDQAPEEDAKTVICRRTDSTDAKVNISTAAMQPKKPPAPVSVSSRPPPNELAMPPTRPVPSTQPMPDERHSVGKTWAASVYIPTCTALIAAPATAMPPISCGSPSANHASHASDAAATSAEHGQRAARAEARDQPRDCDHAGDARDVENECTFDRGHELEPERGQHQRRPVEEGINGVHVRQERERHDHGVPAQLRRERSRQLRPPGSCGVAPARVASRKRGDSGSTKYMMPPRATAMRRRPGTGCASHEQE